MRPYCKTVTLGTSYAPVVAAAVVNAPTPDENGDAVSLGSMGLIFTGYILAPAANSGNTEISGDGSNSIIMTEDFSYRFERVNLSQLQAKVGTSGTLLLFGQVD